MAGPAPAPAPAGPSGLGGFNGAMPALPSPAAGIVTNPINPYGGMIGQIGGALAGYPAMQQQQQEQKLKLQQQQAAYAQQQLAMIGQYVSSNPQYADNPQVAQRIAQLSQQAGVPPPLTSDGKVDIEAIVGSNKQDWNKLTPEQQQAFEQMPGPARTAALKSYRNVPPEILAMDQYNSPTTQRAMMANMTHVLTSPNGNISDAYSILDSIMKGGNADPAVLADATTQMKDKWEQTFELKKATVDFTKIKEADVNAWHQQSLALDTAKLNAKIAGDKHREQDADAKISQANQRLQIEALKAASYVRTSQARTQAYVSSIQNKNAQTGVVMSAYKSLVKERADTESAIANLQKAKFSASSSADTTQVDQQINALTAQEAQIDAGIQSYGAALDSSTNYSISKQQGGKTVTTVGGPPPVRGAGTATTNPTGQPMQKVNPDDGKTYYLWPDGNYYTAPPSQH